MKSLFLPMLLIAIFAQSALSQSSDLKDRDARVKFSIHLIDYMNPPTFENAISEAYYNVIKFTFAENLNFPKLELSNLSNNDRTIIMNYISLLEQSASNPLPWSSLLELEKQYLIWLDRANRKYSKYRN
jgi:hypothetical protein